MGALREAPVSSKCDPKPTGFDQCERPAPFPADARVPRTPQPASHGVDGTPPKAPGTTTRAPRDRSSRRPRAGS